MSYLSKKNSVVALHKMKSFHDECESLYRRHGFNLLDNLGRRNIIMSQAQEKYFAESLASEYEDVVSDGGTGQPDIIVGELGKELECKLTSRHSAGTISFQSDYETLVKKGDLDYLYVIASEDFQKFAVLHFESLTIDDFRPLSSGSRGKVAMYKHKGMKKCNVLVGNVINNNMVNLKKIERKLSQKNLTAKGRQKLLKSKTYWTETPAKFSYVLEGIH